MQPLPHPLAALHSGCFVCGTGNPLGLHASFVAEGDGSVVAHVRCDPTWSGYRGSVHGGITTSLLDGAMVHVLFTRGVAAVTARLLVAFHSPVLPDDELTVSARLLSARHGRYELEAELNQLGKTRATATGHFIRMHGFELGPNQWERAGSDQR